MALNGPVSRIFHIPAESPSHTVDKVGQFFFSKDPGLLHGVSDCLFKMDGKMWGDFSWGIDFRAEFWPQRLHVLNDCTGIFTHSYFDQSFFPSRRGASPRVHR